MPNFSFRGRRELSTGLQLPQKDQNHMANSHCCQVCSQVGAKGAVIAQILDCKYLTVEQKLHDRVKSITYFTKL